MNKINFLALVCILPLFIHAPVHSESQEPSGRNCRRVKSVIRLAEENNLDTASLIKLREIYCSANHSDKLFILPEPQAKENCSEITTIGNFSYISNDQQSRELSKQIVNYSKFICKFDDDNESFSWENGNTAKSRFGDWYYPNGNTAKSRFGDWYYPNGNTAKSRFGDWYYPNGNTAKSRFGDWYDPNGNRASSSVTTSILPWACRRVEQEICDRRSSLVSKLQQSNDSTNEDYKEFYLNQSIVMLAWYAKLKQ